MDSTCLIFDLDGTLVDSEVLNCQAYVDLIPEITDSAEILVARYQGGKFADILANIQSRYSVTLPDRFEHTYRAYVARLFERELRATEGVASALAEITEPCCVASSAPRVKIKHALEITRLTHFFGEKIFSCYDIGMWKPEPDIFLHAAKCMKHAPSRCIVIEDSNSGVEAAMAAKIPVLHFTNAPIQKIDPGYFPFNAMSLLPILVQRLRLNSRHPNRER
jgi:HAD superfamily hydrolase (TIGR01509 family)